MHHGLLAERTEDRELRRLRDEREAEVEVEDVGAGQEPRECRPLRRLSAREAAPALERPVGLGVEGVAIEDDELRVHTAPPQRLNVRPRHAGRVHRAMDDSHRLSQSRSMPSAASCSRWTGLLRVQHRAHRQPHRRALVYPDLGVDEDLEPWEAATAQLLVRAAGAPVLVRVGAIGRWVEERLGVDVDRSLDRPGHVLGIRVVPRDDGIEAVVELDVRDGRHAGRPCGRVRAGVRSPRRPRWTRGCRRRTRSSAGTSSRRRARPRSSAMVTAASSERSMSCRRKMSPRSGRSPKRREPVAAGLGRLEDLRVVRQVERAAHAWTSTSTSTRRALALRLELRRGVLGAR